MENTFRSMMRVYHLATVSHWIHSFTVCLVAHQQNNEEHQFKVNSLKNTYQLLNCELPFTTILSSFTFIRLLRLTNVSSKSLSALLSKCRSCLTALK